MVCNWSVYLTLITSHSLLNLFLMRIALAAIIVICGANLLVALLDSSLVNTINERNETIQRQIDQMWQSGNCTQNQGFSLRHPSKLLQYRQQGNTDPWKSSSSQSSQSWHGSPLRSVARPPTSLTLLLRLSALSVKRVCSDPSSVLPVKMVGPSLADPNPLPLTP